MNKNIRKHLALVLIFILVLMIFAACKKTSKPEETNANITPTEAPVQVDDGDEEDIEEPVEEPDDEEVNTFFYSEDFEGDSHRLQPRGGAFLEVTTDAAKSGNNSLKASGRDDHWKGVRFDLSEFPGGSFQFSAWLMYDEPSAEDTLTFSATLQEVAEGRQAYPSISQVDANKGEWVFIEGEVVIPEDITQASVYFELNANIPYYFDDFEISGKVSVNRLADLEEVPSLAEFYKDNWLFGAAVPNSVLGLKTFQTLINHHFNSLTMENEMKPSFLLDQNTSQSDLNKYSESAAINFSHARVGLDYAKANGLKMRGHTLVWHSQTPDWFFTVDYTDNGELASREVMLKRMENYIKEVLEFVQTNYPGVIYAWDVVNEAISPGDGQPNGFRVKDSKWYEILGEDFVIYAFRFARKYADPDVTLFYNDYNEYDRVRQIYALAERLMEEDLIDGIGMQSHLSLSYPTVSRVIDTAAKFGELGLEIHITELDVGLGNHQPDDAGFERQAKYYKDLFTNLKRLDDEGIANITSVTLWGTTDDRSWRSDRHPLLFFKDFTAKPAFWGVMLDDRIN